MSVIRYLRDAAVFAPCYIALDWASYIDPVGPFNITPWNPQAGARGLLDVVARPAARAGGVCHHRGSRFRGARHAGRLCPHEPHGARSHRRLRRSRLVLRGLLHGDVGLRTARSSRCSWRWCLPAPRSPAPPSSACCSGRERSPILRLRTPGCASGSATRWAFSSRRRCCSRPPTAARRTGMLGACAAARDAGAAIVLLATVWLIFDVLPGASGECTSIFCSFRSSGSLRAAA